MFTCFEVIWKEWWALGCAAADFHNIDSHECLSHLTAERRHVEQGLGTTHWRVKPRLHLILFRWKCVELVYLHPFVLVFVCCQLCYMTTINSCKYEKYSRHIRSTCLVTLKGILEASDCMRCIPSDCLSRTSHLQQCGRPCYLMGGMLPTKLDQSMQDQITDFIWFHKLNSLISILKCFEFSFGHGLD